MREVSEGVRRATFRLPLGIDHVHVYFLRGVDGWTIVDTGLGVEDAEAAWAPLLAELDAPVVRILVTHFHPDHVGGAWDLAALTGAPVLQGRADFEQCVRAWGPPRRPGALIEFMLEHGLPESEVDQMRSDSGSLRSRVRYHPEPALLDPGDRVEGWDVLLLPGHADGHIALLREGVLVAGDAILGGITPTVGLYPEARPDPLGDYLESLRRIEGLEATIALGGHGSVIAEPTARAREIALHHDDRLARTRAALGSTPRSAYDVSLTLFPNPLPPSQRRFALAESLAHLERLVLEGEAARLDGDGSTAYTASSGTQRRVSRSQNASPA